jgi:DNA-binding GntR family transcriptional regulator
VSAHRSSVPAEPLVERAPLRDQIRELLTARIFDGTYPPGARLVETRIATELRVSQAPVREALRELEILRLVEHVPFRGARVRMPAPEELLAVFPVREALEVLAVRLGYARLAADPAPLRRHLAAMREAAQAGDAHAMIANDVGFHAAIVAAPESLPLREAWQALRVDRHVHVSFQRLHLDLRELAETHVPLLEAFESGTKAQAVKAVRAHLARFARASADGAS